MRFEHYIQKREYIDNIILDWTTFAIFFFEALLSPKICYCIKTTYLCKKF